MALVSTIIEYLSEQTSSTDRLPHQAQPKQCQNGAQQDSKSPFTGAMESDFAEPIADGSSADHRHHQRHVAANRKPDEPKGDQFGNVREGHQGAKGRGMDVPRRAGTRDKRSQKRSRGAHENAEKGCAEPEYGKAAALRAEAAQIGHPRHQQNEGPENSLKPSRRQRDKHLRTRRRSEDRP